MSTTEFTKQAINTFPVSLLEPLSRDCARAFTSRSLSDSKEKEVEEEGSNEEEVVDDEDDAQYSTGQTFMIKPNEKPRSALEALALRIFHFHAKNRYGENYLEKFDSNNSCAEWWTQVIDNDSDIGYHWDRDYGLEEDDGVHAYPLFGTVTYLSNCGAPTMVIDKVGTSTSEEPISTDITKKFIIRRPEIGSHICFDGHLLHGSLMEIIKEDNEEDTDEIEAGDEEDGEESIEELINNIKEKRITFLVNIWIDHIPSQAMTCPDEISSQFECNVENLEEEIKNLEMKYSEPPSPIIISTEDCVRSVDHHFKSNNNQCFITIPITSIPRVTQDFDKNGGYICYEYNNNEEELGINYAFFPLDDEEEEFDEEDEEFDEEDEEEGEEEEEEDVEDEDEKPPSKKSKSS